MSEPSNRHVFQSFWLGAVSPYEAMCMKSFIDHGHDFHLYTYDLDIKIPDGIQVKDASTILDEGEYFTYKSGSGRGSHSAFSNLFRYELLYEKGGWWVDTDVVCLTGDVETFEQFFALEDSKIVNGAVLFFNPGDDFLRSCIEETRRIRDRAKWGQIGPRLITQVLKQQGLFSRAQPKSSCYPIHHVEALDLLRPASKDALSKRLESSLFLHLWNEIFRRHHVEKALLPPRGSLLRSYAERHPVEGWLGEYEADALENLLDAIGSESARNHQKSSLALMKQGRHEEAIAAMKRAIECSPRSAQLHLELGRLLQKVDQLDEAENAYRKAAKFDPNHAKAWRQLSVVLAQREHCDEAASAAQRAVECDPNDAGLYHHLGTLLHKVGRSEAAEAAFRQAIELKPDHAKAYRQLSVLFAKHGRQDEAIAAAEAAVECDPDDAGLKYHLGKTLQRMGRLKESRAVYRQVLEMAPDHDGARQELNTPRHLSWLPWLKRIVWRSARR